ncbi:hypothetical protein WA026_001240 [Henosepilachna vigintioctopunctata]|uniref:Prominin-like protein n=1 Tax=Henosepilachna vigintioctopunctata TaxID=420089 RepID=A0AAW1UKK1_9CUCU
MEPGGAQRRRANFFSFSVCCLVLFLACDVCSSLNTTKIAVAETMVREDGPHYKDLNVTGNYKSNPNYDPDGFEWLYSITKKFMNLILDEAIPKDVITISDNKINFDLTNHVSDILRQYAYFVALCLIIVIFALVMFVSGFCFTCYCCCCNCCGSSHSKNTTKNENCKKITLITLLIICAAFITFGGVCILNSNLRLRDGIQEFPGDMQNSIDDARTFLDVTRQQIDILLSINFNEFISWVSKELDKCFSSVQEQIDLIDVNITDTGIFNITASFENIEYDVNWFSNFSEKLENVTKSLEKVKTDLSSAIQVCSTLPNIRCQDLEKSIGQFNFNVNVTTVKNQIKIVSDILEKTNGIENGQQKLNNVIQDIRNKTENGWNTAKTSIRDAANEMQSSANKISAEIQTLETYFPNSNDKGGNKTFVDEVQKFVDNYNSYLYYFGLFICSLLFSIVCVLAVGMIFGFFKTSIFNKIGRFFLLCGTTFMFYFAIILAVVTLVYFLIGMISQQAVCKSFRDPSNSTFFKLVDQYDLSKTGLNIKVSEILNSIHSNESVYNALDLKNQFDLDNLHQYLNQFKEQLDGLVNVVDKFEFSQFKILTEDQMKALENFPDPQVSNVETFMNDLNKIIMEVKFDELYTALNVKIEEIDEMKDTNPILNSLREKLDQARDELNIEMNILKAEIIPNTSDGTDIAKKLDKQLKFGEESFQDGRKKLIRIIEDVQELVGVRSPITFKEIVSALSNETYKVCEDYVNLVSNDIRNDVGQCGPLGVIYDATLTSACDKVALQMNSFWFVLLWTMLLFLPTAIISAKLAKVYKSEKPLKRSNVDAVRVPTRSAKKKSSKETEVNDRTPIGLNRNVNLLSRNVDDLTLDKWEQYPPSEPGHSSRTQEEYRTPPPYFTQFNTVVNSPKLYDNTFDELNRWEQYPESMKKSTRF